MPKWYTLPYATFGHSKRVFSGLLLSQSDDSIKLSPPALQLQMTLNHNLFPSEMMTDLNHTDYKFIRIHLNLQPLQNDTVTNDKFDDMPHKNNISSATLSTLLWTLFSISVLVSNASWLLVLQHSPLKSCPSSTDLSSQQRS
jgi:hypothetical protein